MRLWVAACAILVACSFEHGTAPLDAPPDTGPTTATLFVADFSGSKLYRIAVARGADPTITLTLSVPGALSPYVLPSGELLVSDVNNPAIHRFLTPLGTPAANGVITGLGLGTQPAQMTMVDSDLFVVNPSVSD